MRRILPILAFVLLASPAMADEITIPPAQHGLFDTGKLPPEAQGFAPLGAAGGVSMKAVPYAALPLSAPVGTAFFCTNCGNGNGGQPVFFNGNSWVDATGAGAQHP